MVIVQYHDITLALVKTVLFCDCVSLFPHTCLCCVVSVQEQEDPSNVCQFTRSRGEQTSLKRARSFVIESVATFIFPHTRSRPPLIPAMPTLPEEEEDSPEELNSTSSSPSIVSQTIFHITSGYIHAVSPNMNICVSIALFPSPCSALLSMAMTLHCYAYAKNSNIEISYHRISIGLHTTFTFTFSHLADTFIQSD